MSSTKSKNQAIFAILKSLNAFPFLDLVKSYYKGTSLIPEGKNFTILIPSAKEIKRLSLITDDDSYVKYIIKSHFIPQDIQSVSAKNTKVKTRTNNYDLKVLSNASGRLQLEDTNKNHVDLKLADLRKAAKLKGVNYSVYQVQSGSIDCNHSAKKNKVGKKSKKIHGGLDNQGNLNMCRLDIHQQVYSKFKIYLHNRQECINPYGPACAGLLKVLEQGGHEHECKKVAYLMTHCSFALFYILVQPFKTVGNYLIPDDIITQWHGMEYYPADICGYFCQFVQKHLPNVYSNTGGLIEKINGIRSGFRPGADYTTWLMNAYKTFEYPDEIVGLLTPEEKYFYDELTFKLCNIYCNVTRHESNFDNVLLYNMQMLELLFPCNDEMAEAKFIDPNYKEFVTREELLAPGSVYKFVFSTDFLSMFVNLDILKQYEHITDKSSDITLNNTKIFNSEQFRCNVLNTDKEKIHAIHEYNKMLYC